MSEFEDTYNDDEVECPYCGSKYQPEAEDFDESGHEEDCEECGKIYLLHQSFSVTHIACPDCELNGGQHKYSMESLSDGRKHPFCTICGKCQHHRELI